MAQPKRLITLDARTDAIAERVKRQTRFGFSSWVRQRLLAWDAEKKHGETDRGMQALRDARRQAAWVKTAELLARQLSAGDRTFIDADWTVIVGGTYVDALAQVEERDGVIE